MSQIIYIILCLLVRKNSIFGIEHFVCILSAWVGDAHFVTGGMSERLSVRQVTMKSYLPDLEIYLLWMTRRGFCQALFMFICCFEPRGRTFLRFEATVEKDFHNVSCCIKCLVVYYMCASFIKEKQKWKVLMSCLLSRKKNSPLDHKIN